MTDRLWTRRRLLKGATGSAFVLVVAPWLTGCDDDGDKGEPTASPTSSASSGTPAATAAATEGAMTTGGTVRVGAAGAPSDLFNPFNSVSLSDYIGLYAVYDSLAILAGADVRLSLAESVTPNEDGSEWTIVIKEAAFHDGSPLTSEDVAYSLRTLADPAISPFLAANYAIIDLANMQTPDDRTLVVPLNAPRGDFVEVTLATWSMIVKDGTLGGPGAIGSGPFKLEAYEAGKSVRLVRNDEYWGGAPHLDGLEVVAISDATARLNALKGGEIDYATSITPAGAQAEADNGNISVLQAGVANSIAHGFSMNVGLPPFDNPDAVRAVKLAVDRRAMINIVLLGFGELGNDLVGRGLPGYNDSIAQTERDVDEARRLFEAAGVTELTLRTGEITPGGLAAAELLVQQLGEAGVTLTLDEIPADQFWTDFEALFTTPFQSVYWINRPAGVHVGSYTGSNSGFNITGTADPDYDAMLAAAQATVDPSQRAAAIEGVQAYLHENDGMVIWGFQEDLNASVTGLSGVQVSQSLPLFDQATLET